MVSLRKLFSWLKPQSRLAKSDQSSEPDCDFAGETSTEEMKERIIISRPIFELSEVLLAELRSHRLGPEDPFTREHDAFLLDGGLGPPTYLTSTGCVIWVDDMWGVKGTRGEAVMAILVGARKTKLDSLKSVLPPRPQDLLDCPECKATGRFTLVDTSGKPLSLFCSHCAGLGWTAASLPLAESVL